NRDGQVCLADAGRAHEEEALLDDGKLLGELTRSSERVQEPLVRVCNERPEVAVLITPGNPRIREKRVTDLGSPAVAARDALHAVDLDGLPTSAVAERTGHEENLTRVRRVRQVLLVRQVRG